MSGTARRWASWTALVAVTAASVWLSAARLRISSDLSLLFPSQREAAALGRYTRIFGGGDLGIVLVRGDDPDDVLLAAGQVRDELSRAPSVATVFDRAPLPEVSDATRAWARAGPEARARLARALTREGMLERLEGTRALILAPGSEEAEGWLARDPLRLSTIPWEKGGDLAAGVSAAQASSFAADGGKARLVVVEARGRAFEAASADAVVRDFEAARGVAQAAHPRVSIELSGGHAIAHATAELLQRDLALSGTLSLVLASLMFVATFRRARALAAVLPPLILGTLWTTGLAALVTPALSAMAIAFAAVVVGVGVDTGVHVYAALLRARREGLSPADAAASCRRTTARPTLLAAGAAALAFGSLGLSSLAALRQLGILCGVGELLTAVAILWVTPEIGALLERGAPPPERPRAWERAVLTLTGSRRRALVTLGAAAALVATVGAVGWPVAGDALVAIRPRALAPLATQEAIYRLFGGRPGQWIVLSEGRDAESAERRADAVAEALEPLAARGDVDGFDALAPFAPAAATQRARLAERDRLDLPGLRGTLEAALREKGFDVEACAPALEGFSHPSEEVDPVSLEGRALAGWVVRRHLGRDDAGVLAATYVRPNGDRDRDDRALAAIRAADPDAIVTGYPVLEAALRESLAHDLPRVAIVALVVVVIALRATLGRGADVAIALSTLAAEVAAVALLMRALHVRWHVYDALVLPVLLGVTIDEAMFLLHAARAGSGREDADSVIARALREQGSLVVATALTTAAGFGALLVCRFEGLFDLGELGAIGVLLGLVAALVLVPAGLRLLPGTGRIKRP